MVLVCEESRYNTWRQKVVIRLLDLIYNSGQLDKSELEQKLDLGAPWFKYFQVSHLLSLLIKLVMIIF